MSASVVCALLLAAGALAVGLCRRGGLSMIGVMVVVVLHADTARRLVLQWLENAETEGELSKGE